MSYAKRKCGRNVIKIKCLGFYDLKGNRTTLYEL